MAGTAFNSMRVVVPKVDGNASTRHSLTASSHSTESTNDTNSPRSSTAGWTAKGASSWHSWFSEQATPLRLRYRHRSLVYSTPWSATSSNTPTCESVEGEVLSLLRNWRIRCRRMAVRKDCFCSLEKECNAMRRFGLDVKGELA